MALAVMLLVGAGLLVKSFANLERVDPGFASGRVLIFDLDHPKARYPERGQLVSFYELLFARLAGLPGVTRVAASYDPPLASNWYQSFELPDVPPPTGGQDRGGVFRTVTPGYFEALGVKLIEGRGFTEADDVGAPGAVIVNEALSRRFLPGRSPLGQRFEAATTQWRWGEAVPRRFHVVGVVKNEVFGDLAKPPEPAFYLPFRQTPQDRMSVMLRTRGEPLRLLPEIRRQLRELDPRLAVARVTTLEEAQSDSVARPRFRALVLAAFASAALLLALIGLSSVLSEAVHHRRREIGVRLALGAEPRNVFLWLMGEGLRPAIRGLVLGLGGALALGRLLARLLYEVTPADPGVYAAVALSLMAAGAATCLIPAWRASRTDPVIALRAE
jgi:putative ABC transport system permease protein